MGAVPSSSFTYTYDAAGNVLTQVEAIGGVTDATTTFTYDDRNNLKTETQSGAGVANKRVEFSYNALNQQTEIDTYAATTAMQLVSSTTYDYDLDHRLTGITSQQGTTPSFSPP